MLAYIHRAELELRTLLVNNSRKIVLELYMHGGNKMYVWGGKESLFSE